MMLLSECTEENAAPVIPVIPETKRRYGLIVMTYPRRNSLLKSLYATGTARLLIDRFH